mgnify:FL=1
MRELTIAMLIILASLLYWISIPRPDLHTGQTGTKVCQMRTTQKCNNNFSLWVHYIVIYILKALKYYCEYVMVNSEYQLNHVR